MVSRDVLQYAVSVRRRLEELLGSYWAARAPTTVSFPWHAEVDRAAERWIRNDAAGTVRAHTTLYPENPSSARTPRQPRPLHHPPREGLSLTLNDSDCLD